MDYCISILSKPSIFNSYDYMRIAFIKKKLNYHAKYAVDNEV